MSSGVDTKSRNFGPCKKTGSAIHELCVSLEKRLTSVLPFSPLYNADSPDRVVRIENVQACAVRTAVPNTEGSCKYCSAHRHCHSQNLRGGLLRTGTGSSKGLRKLIYA